jgi:hypothetical protein
VVATQAPAATPITPQSPTEVPATAAPSAATPTTAGVVDLGQVPYISSKVETISVDFLSNAPTLQAFDSIWFVAETLGRVTRWDPGTRQVLATIQVGDLAKAKYGDPKAAVATDDAVWIISSGTQEVVKVDPQTNEIVDRISLPKVDGRDLDAVSYMVLVGDTAWVHDYAKHIAQGVDLETGEAAGTFTNVTAISSLDGSLWISRADGVVAQIDPETNEVVKELPRGSPLPVLSAEGSMWGFKDSIWRMDPETGETLAKIILGVPVRDMEFASGSVWATVSPGAPPECHNGSYLVKIDPKTNTVVAKTALDCPFDITPYKDTVWVDGEDDNHTLLTQVRP